MTDDHDDLHEHAELAPADEAEVRRLLAEAGGPVATPPDVVARLDETLADLVAERAAEPATEKPATEKPAATVTSLASRRRRWPKVMLAAAAVVVGGYGLGALATNASMSGGDDSGAGGGMSADSADSAPEAQSDAGGGDNLAGLPRDGQLYSAHGDRIRISSDDFDAGVLRALGSQALAGEATTDSSGQAATNEQKARKAELRKLREALGRCAAPPSERRDRWFVVRYDGKVATLVVGPRRQGTVDARVYSCDGTTLLRDSTVDLD